jgi:hypothetical protein
MIHADRWTDGGTNITKRVRILAKAALFIASEKGTFDVLTVLFCCLCSVQAVKNTCSMICTNQALSDCKPLDVDAR